MLLPPPEEHSPAVPTNMFVVLLTYQVFRASEGSVLRMIFKVLQARGASHRKINQVRTCRLFFSTLDLAWAASRVGAVEEHIQIQSERHLSDGLLIHGASAYSNSSDGWVVSDCTGTDCTLMAPVSRAWDGSVALSSLQLLVLCAISRSIFQIRPMNGWGIAAYVQSFSAPPPAITCVLDYSKTRPLRYFPPSLFPPLFF